MNRHFFQKSLESLISSKPKVLFIHIPKTGGTSIDFAFKKIYRISSFNLDPACLQKSAAILYDLEKSSNESQSRSGFGNHIVLYEMTKGTKYISGHIRFNLDIWTAFHEQYAYITILREPIKRYLSNYFYDAYKKSSHAKIEDDLRTFIKSKRGQNRGSSYVNCIGGFSDNDSTETREKMKVAKDNLEKFEIVGFLENLDAFTLDCQSKLGLKLKVPHRRKNPAVNQEVEPSLLAEIKKICEPDREFYEYARETFSSLKPARDL